MVTPATQLGWRGEAAARTWLERRGYVFVCCNYRTRFGELDIIMQRNELTVFVEVKVRRSHRFGVPEESISERKLERLRAAVDLYCQRQSVTGSVRLDLVVVEQQGSAWNIRHISGID